MSEEKTKASRPRRRLYYVPILHTAAELGGLEQEVRRRMGEEVFLQRQRVINAAWDRVEMWASTLEPSLARCKLYQDGLPICGKEEQIVRDLAARQSRNHRLLLRLIERGATLLGTESPELLLSEYELAKAIVSPDADRKALEPVAADLLAKRDAFIAQRINQTLREGEFGILFVGLLHNVHRGLQPDIELIVPFGK
ncbi:MAG: hypothetical protein ABSH08_19910 [Tepidisphaeraceae bacterium]